MREIPFRIRKYGYKKEVLVFVIGLGITDPEAKRTLNAMALAGGLIRKG